MASSGDNVSIFQLFLSIILKIGDFHFLAKIITLSSTFLIFLLTLLLSGIFQALDISFSSKL
jgi:hypothetical protein